MANSFLNYFFEDFDEQALANGSAFEAVRDRARFIQVPSSLVASRANCLLKSAGEDQPTHPCPQSESKEV
jgi:hypothetical protein